MARCLMVVFNTYANDARVRREAEALIQRGDSVDCICLGDMGQRTVICSVRLFPGSGSKYYGSGLFGHLAANLRFFCFAFVKAGLLHLRNAYDIVQVHTMPDFLVFAAAIPKLFGAKVILDVHDLMPELYMTKFGLGYQSWIVRLITWIERRSVAFADRAICVHRPHLDALVRHGNPKNKFQILLNAPDEAIFATRPPRPRDSREFRLVYYGSIPKRAGLDIALKAVHRAQREIPGLKFQIIGRGDGLDDLTQAVRDLDLGGCVEFLPVMDVRRLPPILAQAAAVVIPYVETPFTHFVLPTKLLECAMLEVPVIVSRLRTIQAYFNENMVAYVRPGNEFDITRQILRLHRNPEVATALASNALSFAREHTWRREAAAYFELVDSLLPPHRRLQAPSQDDWAKDTTPARRFSGRP